MADQTESRRTSPLQCATEAIYISSITTDKIAPSSKNTSIKAKIPGPAVQYSNGPFLRASMETLAPLSFPSPPTSPKPTFSSKSTRTLTLDSTSVTNSDHDTNIELQDIRINLICSWLHQKQLQKMWSNGEPHEGVVVKKSKGEYVCCPAELAGQSDGLYDAARQLNVKVSMTINTRTTRMILGLYDAPYIPLSRGLRLQVLLDISWMPKCPKNQFAAFVRNPPSLIVWDDDPAHIVDRVQDLEQQMMSMIWKTSANSEGEKLPYTAPTVCKVEGLEDRDSERSSISPRRTMLAQPIIIATTLALMCVALAAGWRNLAVEIKVQRTWLCLLFLAVSPLQAWVGLFFFQTLPTCMAQIFGRVSQLQQNSRFYSGKRSPRIQDCSLPHLTVQCPVYKESLGTVIEPTIRSIQCAISTYEMQGGTANIFINDDGMQVIPDDQARRRQDFYEEHNIGWVARPRHNLKASVHKKAFQRAGRFKKASNMNYGLNISVRVDEKLQNLTRSAEWTAEQEHAAYNDILSQVIAEDEEHTWAAGNIRVGDYILLVDADTRIPADCLLDAISEMEQSPNVAIIQFSSSVMNVTQSWFEKGITFFTQLIYTAIEFAVANGDVAPFVGHNAFLRWSAVQDVAYSPVGNETYHRFWCEDTVSEDFEMALRLQTSGYEIRLASYASKDFKEGVSLTVYDELARWEKYAYGCSELIFNPISQWIFKGPLTPLFRKFVFSNIPFHSKISIMAYIGTYFAIGSSWFLTLLNYFLVGWYNGYLDHYYIDSFKIYFSIIIVFNILGNIALAILRYRIGEKKLLSSLCENFKWLPLLVTFLGGISLHISQAILCHLFSVDMTWGATSKEAISTSFFHEVPTILRKFRFTFAFCLVLTATMVALSGLGPFHVLVPHDWQITKFTAVFPLALLVASHAMLPIALNPGLMQFTF